MLVRTVPAPDRPPEERELRGEPTAIAAELRRYADLGIAHLQVQLRPNEVAAVEAFAGVIAILHR